MQLDNLDFADDLALLSHTQQQVQKTTSVVAASAALGLKIHEGKARFSDTTQHAPIQSQLTEKIRKICEGTGIGKARAAYLQLKNVWNSKQLSINTTCQNSSTVRGGSLENYESHHPEDTSVYYQLSTPKYLGSVGQTLSATNYCGRGQCSEEKSGRSAGSG
ncbi:unnamed protein product [Schistosoma mattheei]|uniref:Uncharacterized protein n=1 Tax=Schistosoma mattheei TaxID=31246 RepID=A0A183NE51_9TREM|nr:unnamed protein product [Schistosoma mattheei]